MKHALSAITVVVFMLAGCSSSVPANDSNPPSVEPTSTTETSPSATPEVSAQTNEPDSGVDLTAYVLPATTTWDGFDGYWFTDGERSTRCVIALKSPAINQPYVSCDVAAEFAVRDVDIAREDCGELAGTFQGWKAMLTDETTVMGSCQSDVPIGMMCSQLAGTGESEFCDQEWFNVPVLPDGEPLRAGTFSCVVTGTQVRCTSESGQEMTIPPSSD